MPGPVLISSNSGSGHPADEAVLAAALLAYGIVQDHGGWIDVESELGKGSCFSVYFPAESPP